MSELSHEQMNISFFKHTVETIAEHSRRYAQAERTRVENKQRGMQLWSDIVIDLSQWVGKHTLN